MIVPSFRLYGYAIRLIWKHILCLTLFLWAGIAVIYYSVHDTSILEEYGWWLPLMIAVTYFIFMDIKLAIMIMRHEEKKKWKRYRLKNIYRE